jgi:MFS family permease
MLRRYLIATQLWVFCMATLLALLAQSGQQQPWSLLALTFALSVGATMAMPAQAATTPKLVPRARLAPAVALNSAGMNIARSVGPALGGIVVAKFGAPWAFAQNALNSSAWPWCSGAGNARRRCRWCRPKHSAPRCAPACAMPRTPACSSRCWRSPPTSSSLPIVVRTDLDAGSGTYGLLLSDIGIGALACALLLPRLRARMDRDRPVWAVRP